jgi:signal transduction histidine kinase
MSLRTKIALFNAVVLALAFLAAGAALLTYARAIAPLRRAVAEEAESVQLAEALRRQMDNEASTVTRALARGDVESARAYQSANARFDALLARASQLAADAPARDALAAARQGEATFNQRADEALSEQHDPSTALRLVAESVLPARDAASAALDHFLDQQEASTRGAQRQASRAALAAVTTFVAFLAVAGAAAAISSLTLSRHMLDRLGTLGRATEAIAGGARTVQVPVRSRGGDELDQLARAFNGMVRQLAAAEVAARQADELKASFLASVSHDLRTPITTIKGMLETLRREDAQWDAASQREFLDVAARESDRLARLVANLLDLSRMEAGSWPLHREPVDLPALVRTVAGDLGVAGGPLDGRAVEIVAATSQTAWADEDQMVRVVQNLLTNAAKFSPPESPIAVRIEDALLAADSVPGTSPGPFKHETGEARGVVVHVLDQGPGVPEPDQSHVFDKFFRASAARSTIPGTGLGLAICRGIVEAHGGRIWVRAGPGGRGARFSFVVPAAPATVSSIATDGESATAPEPVLAEAAAG